MQRISQPLRAAYSLGQVPRGHERRRTARSSIRPEAARTSLRSKLEALSVPNAQSYGTHCFRRGHAEVYRCSNPAWCSIFIASALQDMRKCGCTLAEILRAGQWRSAAFTSHLDEAALDKVVVLSIMRSSAFLPYTPGLGFPSSSPER